MTLAEKIREAVEALPAEKQAEVLDFAEFLKARTAAPLDVDALDRELAALRAERAASVEQTTEDME